MLLVPIFTLMIHHLVIRTDNFVFFPFWKRRYWHPCQLPTLALRPPFCIRQAQRVQVSLRKSSPIGKLFTDLSSTNKPAIYLSFSSSQILVLFLLRFPPLRPSFFLTLYGLFGRNYPVSLLVCRVTMGPWPLIFFRQ